jgi:hypothetical protein
MSKINREMKEKMRALFLEGVDVQFLAERFGCHYSTAYMAATGKVRRAVSVRGGRGRCPQKGSNRVVGLLGVQG